MSVDRLAARFVDDVPEVLDPGKLYVSIEHGTIAHLCACGCGNEVVLPLSPTDWRLTWDGEQLSVAPSVGSWSLPCRSHYLIARGRVQWAGRWSDEEVEAGRKRDRRIKEARHQAVQVPERASPEPTTIDERPATKPRPHGVVGWLRGIVGRR